MWKKNTQVSAQKIINRYTNWWEDVVEYIFRSTIEYRELSSWAKNWCVMVLM